MKENNLVNSDSIDKTALYVMVWKNEGSKAHFKRPVYKSDPYMAYFFDSFHEEEAKRILPKPESYRAVQIRRKHIKHTLSLDLKSKIPSQQIILLGAGLDTLPIFKNKTWKKLVPKLSFFEIDRAPVIDYKISVIDKFNLPCPSEFIRIDYTDENLIQVLEAFNVQFDLKTHIIWEGNIYYLEKNVIIETLEKIRNAFKADLSFTFDYFSSELIDGKINTTAMNDLKNEFNQVGSKFKTGIENIEIFCNENGFELMKTNTIPELDRLYFKNDAPEPELEDNYYHICTMRK